MQKITKTFVRSEKTMQEYVDKINKQKETGEKIDVFKNWQKNLVKEFNNWVIIKNEFPYDAIADVSHMISTKRNVAFDWELLNEEEKEEFKIIRNNYIKENYDVLWENLPKTATFPEHFHLHLILLKREEM